MAIKTDQAARLTNDLKHFLKPFFTFRVYVQFAGTRKKRHFYGNEHQCTYNQVMHKHVPHIVMCRTKAYNDLINLVENTWRGKISSAKIFMREKDDEPFNILCREYYNGEIIKDSINDPVIDSADDVRHLYYYFQNGNLFIEATDPNESINFKKEIDNAFATH